MRALDAATEACCERSNPALQFAYLIIWSVGYALYWQHVFKLLPNLYAAEHHMYVRRGCVGVGAQADASKAQQWPASESMVPTQRNFMHTRSLTTSLHAPHPSLHDACRYTGTAALCLTLGTFLLASGSSPGRVTQHNAAAYLAGERL